MLYWDARGLVDKKIEYQNYQEMKFEAVHKHLPDHQGVITP